MAYRRDGKITYRAVLTRLFDDPDYQRLTPHARLVLLTARLCDKAGPAAIFRFYPATLATQTGLSLDQLEAALGELVAGDWIRRDSHLLWVKNGLKFDPQLSLKSQKHTAAVQRWLSNLPQTPLVRSFRRYYKLAKAIDTHTRKSGMPSVSPDPDPDPDTPLPPLRGDPNVSLARAPNQHPKPDRQARLEAFRRYQAAYQAAREQVDLEHPELSNAQRERLAQDRVQHQDASPPPADKES